MGANVTRFAVSRRVNFKLNDTEQGKVQFRVALYNYFSNSFLPLVSILMYCPCKKKLIQLCFSIL